ncbi:hypothetical protein LTR85_011469 [Meristemomyces frigidus]|nr:hypothetical protein LTR85_011469 [Meristemomyces frigidus]
MSATQANNFRMEHLNHRVSQAVMLKQQTSLRLEQAKTAFIAADEANIAAATKVLDFKAAKPDNDGSAGLSKGAAEYFRRARRAQKATQEVCEGAIEVLEGLQYEFAHASIAVRWARRELREAMEKGSEQR